MRKILTRYNHLRPRQKVVGKSMTDAQYLDECNIEHTLRKYGAIPPQPVLAYGDVSQFSDFAEVLNTLQDAMERFKAQPADLRARFGNRPEAFYEFVTNPANENECIRLGLRVTPAKPEQAATAAGSEEKDLTLTPPTDTKMEGENK